MPAAPLDLATALSQAGLSGKRLVQLLAAFKSEELTWRRLCLTPESALVVILAAPSLGLKLGEQASLAGVVATDRKNASSKQATEDAAAARIQAAQRGRCARQEVTAMKADQYAKKTGASIVIQSRQRGVSARELCRQKLAEEVAHRNTLAKSAIAGGNTGDGGASATAALADVLLRRISSSESVLLRAILSCQQQGNSSGGGGGGAAMQDRGSRGSLATPQGHAILSLLVEIDEKVASAAMPADLRAKLRKQISLQRGVSGVSGVSPSGNGTVQQAHSSTRNHNHQSAAGSSTPTRSFSTPKRSASAKRKKLAPTVKTTTVPSDASSSLAWDTSPPPSTAVRARPKVKTSQAGQTNTVPRLQQYRPPSVTGELEVDMPVQNNGDGRSTSPGGKVKQAFGRTVSPQARPSVGREKESRSFVDPKIKTPRGADPSLAQPSTKQLAKIEYFSQLREQQRENASFAQQRAAQTVVAEKALQSPTQFLAFSVNQ